MNEPKNVGKQQLNDTKEKKVEITENEVNLLSEDELDSVAGGIAPIIKPPTP